MVDHALRYAADGFAVFPCRPGNKEPMGSLVPNGCLNATTDTETIKRWWTQCPNANIGMATGKISGVSVVDLDGPEGINSGRTLKLSSSVTSLTGNGKQLFYADSEGSLGNSVKKLAAGLDIRASGGYVIMPPSLHPSGKRYQWAGECLNRRSLPKLPALLTTTVTNTVSVSNTQRKPDGWIAEALKGMKHGNRDETLTSVLGRLRRDGFSSVDSHAFLLAHAERVDAVQMLEEKIEHIWKTYLSVVQASVTKSETIDEFLKDQQEVEWICKPIIAKKSIGFVAGLPETCKTWMLIDLAVESARDYGNWLSIFPVMQTKVLFIDQERFKGETQRRFSAVIAGKGLKNSDLMGNLFLKCGTTIRLDLEASFQAFRTELLDLRPSLVIVDSFATFHNSPENDRTAIQVVLNRIKTLRDEVGCAFWFINHESKMVFQQVEDGKAPNAFTMMGSVAIVAAAESILIVRKIEDGASMVHHCKSTLATSSKSFTVALTDLDNGGILVKGSI